MRFRLAALSAVLLATAAPAAAQQTDAPSPAATELCRGTDALGRTVERPCPAGAAVADSVPMRLSADQIEALERGGGRAHLQDIAQPFAPAEKRAKDPRGKPEFGLSLGPFGTLESEGIKDARRRRTDPLRQR